jgi:transcriptional regulator with XRE-family HTH domain
MPLSRVVQVQRYLAANLRRLRTRDGMTQEQLAERASLGPVHVRNIERGVENVTLATLVALADAFNVPPGQLLRKAVLQPLRPGRPPARASRVRKKLPKA